MMLNQTDRQLISAAQAGDQAALNELLSFHWQPIYQFVFYKVGNQHDAQDIAQETFIRAFRALPRYQERNATFRTYLGRIALNLIADHWRRLGRAPQIVDVADYRGLLEDTADKPEDQMIKSERQREVAAALAQLPEDQRRAVEMRLIAGLSVQETAQKMNKTEAAVKMLQQRALANLRKMFQDNKPTMLGGDAHDERTISNRGNLKGY
ncbi:MAG: rpoE 2 [Anaerosporomusa subterranea]|nr:rpoE 2 [Anaerosporomusa subterranea]